MEYHQAIQNRAAQTAAVVKQFFPTFTVGEVTIGELLKQALALPTLAQARDDALAAYHAADNAESQGWLFLQGLNLALPKVAEGELDDEVPAESVLLDLLSPVYAIAPRNTEHALERGRKLVSALKPINAYFAGLTPPRPPIERGGKGVEDLEAALAAQPALSQAVQEYAVKVTEARSALRAAATAVDRLNKRFYTKLKAEARSDERLAEALKHISTESDDLPATLVVRKVMQSGSGDNVQVLVSYDTGSWDEGATNTVEWTVSNDSAASAGEDSAFTHSVAAHPSGNALGPFAVGQTVKLRSRVRNSNGSTTGSVRTLTLV